MSLDISTTQSPLIVNYHRVSNRFPEEDNQQQTTTWYRRPEVGLAAAAAQEQGNVVGRRNGDEQKQVNYVGHRQKPRITMATAAAARVRSRIKSNNQSHHNNLRQFYQGKRRSAKPLRVIKRRATPPGIMTRINDAGAQVKEWLLEKKRYLADRRVIGEGPVSLRAATFVGGLAMATTSILGVCYFGQMVGSPAAYVLQIYQFLFGIATVIIEAKNLSMCEPLQDWMADWFPFLCTSAGKGGLYMFMGVLGVALWKDNFSVAIAGSFMMFFGFVYICVHFGLTDHLHHVGIELTQATHFQHEDDVEQQRRSRQQHGKYSSDVYYKDDEFQYPTEYLNGVNQAYRERFFCAIDRKRRHR